MLNMSNILNQYPQRLRGFRETLLKEYLQYKILDIVYSSQYAEKLIFLGGTAIRIVHQGTRFSEDLDFDNKGLKEQDFEDIAKMLETELTLDGYSVSIKNVFKGAYHCYIKFPGLLFSQSMSGHQQQRILIQLDAEAQNYEYTPDCFLLNKFGIFRQIFTVPVSLLLSQKIYTCLNRKREKGRDFFDVVFLMAMTSVDYAYLEQKINIGSKEKMIGALKEKIQRLNLRSLARDVEPFLFESSQKDRVLLFKEWLDTL